VGRDTHSIPTRIMTIKNNESSSTLCDALINEKAKLRPKFLSRVSPSILIHINMFINSSGVKAKGPGDAWASGKGRVGPGVRYSGPHCKADSPRAASD
jgi:hypothetical protein